MQKNSKIALDGKKAEVPKTKKTGARIEHPCSSTFMRRGNGEKFIFGKEGWK